MGLNSNQCHAEKHITSCLLVVILLLSDFFFFLVALFYWGDWTCGNDRMVDEHKKWQSKCWLKKRKNITIHKMSKRTSDIKLWGRNFKTEGSLCPVYSYWLSIICSTNLLSKRAQISYLYSQSALQSENCLKESLFLFSWAATNTMQVQVQNAGPHNVSKVTEVR